jgi:hypothetical protein
MTKLKLSAFQDDKPVKVSLELPAEVHRDLVAYAEVLGRASGTAVADPVKLIVPMIRRFMATDRAFVRACRSPDPHRLSPDENLSRVPSASSV